MVSFPSPVLIVSYPPPPRMVSEPSRVLMTAAVEMPALM